MGTLNCPKEHYGAPYALLASRSRTGKSRRPICYVGDAALWGTTCLACYFCQPKKSFIKLQFSIIPKLQKTAHIFQEPCIPFGVCDYPATKNNHSLSKILCSFSHPLASVLHCIRMLKERSGIPGSPKPHTIHRAA